VKKDLKDLEKHIENCKKFGITPVVAINSFISDSKEEVDYVVESCAKHGSESCTERMLGKRRRRSNELRKAVVATIESGNNKFKPLYDWNLSIEDKIKTIATEIYGADDVEYSKSGTFGLKAIKELGYDKFPVCMAKTQKSFSDVESKIGRPRNFNITVREFEFAAGAGFVIPILGDMMRMPGASSCASIRRNGY
jgi:formate--tetrahydrofolate ligase